MAAEPVSHERLVQAVIGMHDRIVALEKVVQDQGLINQRLHERIQALEAHAANGARSAGADDGTGPRSSRAVCAASCIAEGRVQCRGDCDRD